MRIPHHLVPGMALALALAAGPLDAQQTFYACYVPDVGAVYMIKVTGLPEACLSDSHVEFNWSEGLSELAEGSVGTPILADGAVVAAKLADGAVVAGKIGAGAVAAGNLAFDPATQEEMDAAVDGLGTEGTINDGANPLHWSRLKGVPADFADGTDATGGTSSDVDCVGCVGTDELASGAVTEPKLGFDAATQAELNAHKSSADHDARYATDAELGSIGVINTTSNPVHWSKLKGVPAGLADGTDDGGSATDVVCSGCVNGTDLASGAVTEPKLAFAVATQTELDAHKSSADHDARYATEAELGNFGTINQSSNPVQWTKLKGVPSGFSDGIDNTGGTADNVVCTGCVGTTDIADSSVRAGDIGFAQVNASHIATDAVGSFELSVVRVSTSATVDVTREIAVECPTNGKVLGGGWRWSTSGADVLGRYSYPDTSTSPDSWVVGVSNFAATNATVTVYAICAVPGT